MLVHRTGVDSPQCYSSLQIPTVDSTVRNDTVISLCDNSHRTISLNYWKLPQVTKTVASEVKSWSVKMVCTLTRNLSPSFFMCHFLISHVSFSYFTLPIPSFFLLPGTFIYFPVSPSQLNCSSSKCLPRAALKLECMD